ncbi:type IV pilus biogenesis/stability protein PilW [Alishewanella sp. 16-MA]|uniref:Type IV pilus biogenesis/stability protein PilW n=1 Tax=Alishewanella maricola TaxID=2795740 RepID=A0ABS8C420_9ALTE|nr:type IV pilus biogenesis/stability protein PilW [Alishewanella maricola]MCB5227032.1 type IV pilus biogenesis/stability protein PilW [Alishewanella maricola]
MQRFPVVTALTALLILSGCVSESTYVANERQVSQRSVDNTEAARTRISLGLNYLRRGDTTQALYNLERAKTMAPNLPEVFNALAYYYQTVGEHTQAENAYKQAIAKDSNNADAYNNYGAFLCQIGKYVEAEQLLLSAISKPGYIRVAESYENLALCQLEQNGFEQARTYLGFSISHNGTRISALINSASVNYAMGNLIDAKADLQRIQRLGRVSARSTLLNYLVSEKQGDMATMRHAEQLLLTLYIDTAEAKLLLQQRTLDSEFEQLRERYKQKLLASIQPVVTDTPAAKQQRQPVANPQLRIRRKSTEAEPVNDTPVANTPAAALSHNPTPPTAAVTRQPEPTHSVADIANSFSAQQTKPAELPPALPVEHVLLNDKTVNAAHNTSAATAEELSAQAALITQNEPSNKTTTSRSDSALQATKLESAVTAQPRLNPATATSAAPEAQLTAVSNTPTASSQQTAQEPSAVTPALETKAALETLTTAAVDSAAPSMMSTEPAAALTVQPDPLTKQTVVDTAEPAVTANLPAADPVASVQPISSAQLTITMPQSNNELIADISDVPFHKVAEGESLHSISINYNILLTRLQEWNALTPTSKLRVGQKIWLAPSDAPPDSGAPPVRLANAQPVDEYFHLVAEGDTMFAISYRYNIRLERFMAWNALTEQSRLTIGQKLYIVDPASINHD